MNIENIENYQINNPDLKIRRINNRIHIIYFETLFKLPYDQPLV